MHFYFGMNQIAEDHRISMEIQLSPVTLHGRKMYHRIGIFMSPESDGFIVKSRRKGCMIDGEKRAFYISVFHVQQQMDQRRGVLRFGIIQTAGKTGNRVFDIVRFECFWRFAERKDAAFRNDKFLVSRKVQTASILSRKKIFP